MPVLKDDLLQPILQTLTERQQRAGQPISIALADDHGELRAFIRMAGASLHSGVLAQNKAWTAARDRQATRDLGAWSRSSGRSIACWSDPRFTGFGGGLPLWWNGQVIGAIGISGLSEDEDHAIAEGLVQALLPTLA